MTITTGNTNPKNDSRWARHRSITKGNQNILDDVVRALRGQQGVKFEQFDLAPEQLRATWSKTFGFKLPNFNALLIPYLKSEGSVGLKSWLGSGNPFKDDINTIWVDFLQIFNRRCDDNDTTIQRLFVSYTSTNFDVIYSKWGTTPGHKFFHWAAVADTTPKKRATIDDFVDADDQGDDENAM